VGQSSRRAGLRHLAHDFKEIFTYEKANAEFSAYTLRAHPPGGQRIPRSRRSFIPSARHGLESSAVPLETALFRGL